MNKPGVKTDEDTLPDRPSGFSFYSAGEAVLDRARRTSQGIQERVRRIARDDPSDERAPSHDPTAEGRPPESARSDTRERAK